MLWIQTNFRTSLNFDWSEMPFSWFYISESGSGHPSLLKTFMDSSSFLDVLLELVTDKSFSCCCCCCFSDLKYTPKTAASTFLCQIRAQFCIRSGYIEPSFVSAVSHFIWCVFSYKFYGLTAVFHVAINERAQFELSKKVSIVCIYSDDIYDRTL